MFYGNKNDSCTVYDLGFFNWEILIFTASPSLDSSFIPEAAEGIHPAGYRVLKPPPPILSSTQG